jgi:hypothetical protein
MIRIIVYFCRREIVVVKQGMDGFSKMYAKVSHGKEIVLVSSALLFYLKQ